VPEGLQCVVCLGAEREVIMLDCGHVCSCADCAAELLRVNQPCPVCRSEI
jgi:E3 ubiquitin-protein ligase MUL1